MDITTTGHGKMERGKGGTIPQLPCWNQLPLAMQYDLLDQAAVIGCQTHLVWKLLL